ncbi:hypothetical protein AABB24_007037 [Solanum stoloniferum]|uniref:Uncharacterized protein n=1 Tax=Solanum stoloniferum TaxID=62892 RepID=A0ABD2ULW7_9SOLN
MEVVVLDRFNGNADPEDWISREERYFNFLGFSEEHWLPLPSLYLDGEALEWFRWMFRNNQFFDWTHFKEKLALRFSKQMYAKSPVADTQISNILALLQKIETKWSVTSKQVIVEDVSICAATVFHKEISSPLVIENSSPVDNEDHPDTLINDLSGHVDNMFDKMSTRVFTKEVEGTFSTSRFEADLDDILSPKVFEECFPSFCPMVVSEVHPDTPNKMLDEAALSPKHSEAQLFDGCSPKEMPKRYVIVNSLDRGSNKPKIESETFDDIYLGEFFLEPATIENLYHEKQILDIEYSVPQITMSLDELMLFVEHGKFTREFNTNNILCQFSFNRDDTVVVLGTATNICVWDPGVSFKSTVLIGYTVNMAPLLLLSSTGAVGFIAYANSMTQVWDPGQLRCMHSPVLLSVLPLTVITSLNFSFQNIFAMWAVVDEMVLPKSKMHDSYSEVNPLFHDSSQRVTSREIQPIAPIDIIRPKLFRLPHRLLAQLIRKKISEQASALKMAPEGKEVTPIVCIEWIQGCIKSMTNLIDQELRNFSTLEEIMVFFGTQGVPASYATGPVLEFEYILVGYGVDEFLMLIMHDILDPGDKIIDCPPIFSLYELVALQTCENDRWSFIAMESELELVKNASIVDAYVVHKSMLEKSKSNSILSSWGKFITTTRLMCYLAHFGGHRLVEECHTPIFPQNEVFEK